MAGAMVMLKYTALISDAMIMMAVTVLKKSAVVKL